MNLELLTILTPELTGSGLLVMMGIIQIAISFRISRELKSARRLNSADYINKLRRPIVGLRILACLSFLTAALSIIIPLYLYGLYEFK